jgi:P pilus assembly chaperone PapD
MTEVKESTRNMAEISKNLQENISTQHAEIRPDGYTTFTGKEGRNYMLALTNMDDSYTATVEVYDMDWGNLIRTVNIEPFTAESVVVEMGKGNGIRVYNQSNEKSPGRPIVNASCYHA